MALSNSSGFLHVIASCGMPYLQNEKMSGLIATVDGQDLGEGSWPGNVVYSMSDLCHVRHGHRHNALTDACRCLNSPVVSLGGTYGTV